MKLITLEDLDRWNACGRGDGEPYSDDRIKRIAGAGPWTPLEVAGAGWIPCDDRLWVLLRPEVIGVPLCVEAANAYADRAVRKHALKHPPAREWAERWLSGENRTGTAALATAEAAASDASHAAANFAYAAAHAACAASDAACAAAHAATADAAYAAGAAQAARAAALATAEAAASDASHAAAYATEWRWQLALLRKRLREAARDGEQ